MGPTWVLSAPGVPHVGLMNLAIRVFSITTIHDVSINEKLFKTIVSVHYHMETHCLVGLHHSDSWQIPNPRWVLPYLFSLRDNKSVVANALRQIIASMYHTVRKQNQCLSICWKVQFGEICLFECYEYISAYIANNDLTRKNMWSLLFR